MNNEEVKRLAREVADKNKDGFVKYQDGMITISPEEFMRLIDRVQMQERETCAKLCEAMLLDRGWLIEKALSEAAEAIRARGEVK